MTSRLEKLKEVLSENSVDALLISSVSNITYLTGYAGFSSLEREAYLLITKKDNYIITDGRYTTEVKNIPNFILCERSAENTLQAILKNLVTSCPLKRIGFEENSLSFTEYKEFKKIFKQFKPLLLRSLRFLKEDEEIVAIKNACHMGDVMFPLIVKELSAGITEKQIANKLQSFLLEKNANLSFTSIIAFGENAAIPHHLTSETKLTKNSFILLDYGVRYQNYCSDMTRTIFFGKATIEQKKIYQTVLEAQKRVVDYLNQQLRKRNHNEKGIRASELDKIARKYIMSQGYKTMPHSLGHGIGIEVHEAPTLSPKSKDILENGMVFSIEPGIYLPGVGGVRIEDLYTIQNNTLMQLTQSPKSFIQI